jgi:hypothetical protein
MFSISSWHWITCCIGSAAILSIRSRRQHTEVMTPCGAVFDFPFVPRFLEFRVTSESQLAIQNGIGSADASGDGHEAGAATAAEQYWSGSSKCLDDAIAQPGNHLRLVLFSAPGHGCFGKLELLAFGYALEINEPV